MSVNKLNSFGSEDTGPDDVGSEDTGSDDVGSEDTGSDDVGSEDTWSDDVGSEDIWSDNVGSTDFLINTSLRILSLSLICSATGLFVKFCGETCGGGAYIGLPCCPVQIGISACDWFA